MTSSVQLGRRRPTEAHWDQFIGWDHHGTKTPNFVAVFSWFSGVRTIESSLSYGAGDGNRTNVRSLGSVCSITELRPLVVSDCTSIQPLKQRRSSAFVPGRRAVAWFGKTGYLSTVPASRCHCA